MSPADFRPTARLAVLRERSRLLAGVRRFLEDRGYWEVETPLLSHDICVDAYLEPFVVPADGHVYYLQTSPEFAMKRLLAAGADAVYQITRSFRAGDVGPLHNPEFTIIEWYRVGLSLDALIFEVGDLVQKVAGWPSPIRTTYRAAFLEHAGVDPFEADDRELQDAALARGFQWRSSQPIERDDLLNFLLADAVEPRLGRSAPEVLCDYPPSQAALAQINAAEGTAPATAQRFELYFRGVELANGFFELTDADELRHRNAEQNERRLRAGKMALPNSSRLLDAMDLGLPPCSGVAVGFDRVAMLALGFERLADVTAFLIDRA